MPSYRVNPELEITTTIGCRVACQYCPQPTLVQAYRAGGSTGKVMTLSDFAACLAKLPTNVYVTFAGYAEPWLNEACTDMVELAAKMHQVAIYTTLMGMTEADLERLSRLRFRHFCIHLPDSLGRMRLVVDEAYLRRLQLANQIPGRNFVVYGPLHPEARRVLGFDVRDDSAGLISRGGNVTSLKIAPKSGALKCASCGPKLDHNVLLPDGRVALCCQDYSLDHVIGNLLTDSYESLFESDEYRRVLAGLRQDGADTLCRKCEISSPA